MARKKTRAEKIESGYRLANFKLSTHGGSALGRAATRDASEFGYLSSEYVVKDLTKTFVYTVVVVGLLILAKQYLGE